MVFIENRNFRSFELPNVTPQTNTIAVESTISSVKMVIGLVASDTIASVQLVISMNPQDVLTATTIGSENA